MRKLFAAAGVCLLLSACASKQWVKTGATAADLEADRKQCEYQAELATPDTPSWGLGGATATGISQGLRKGKLEIMCLETKGWSLQAANQPGG